MRVNSEFISNDKAILNINENMRFYKKYFQSVKPFLDTNCISVGTSRIDHEEEAIRYEDDDGYFITDNVLSFFKKNIPGPKVLYRINKDGFRSDNFEPYKKNNLGVLFAGCSLTFGEGLPENLSWPSMLQKKLSEFSKKTIQSYNMGYPAASIQLIIKNTISFINKFGKPKMLFLLLPNIERGIKLDKEISKYVTTIPGPYMRKKEKDRGPSKVYLDFSENYDVSDILLNITVQLNLLENYCNEAGIFFRWATWSPESQEILKELDFKNFLEFDNDYFKKIKNINNLDYWEYGNDGVHFGSSFSTYTSELFFKEVSEKYDV